MKDHAGSTETCAPSTLAVRPAGRRPWTHAGMVLLLAGMLNGAGLATAQPSEEAMMGQALMQMQEQLETPGTPAAPSADAPPPAAGSGWYACDVERVGPGWGNVYLQLECGSAISTRWFVARDDQARDMLAAGLTAITSGKRLFVYLTGTAAYSEVRASYVMK